jgi:DNA-binding transcriptional LysR family regulator
MLVVSISFNYDIFEYCMDRFLALKVFSTVARLGSFSRAARELAISQPSASRIVADLERQVGTGLITRTTRALVLTEDGEDYLARIDPLLDALEEADQAARGAGELRGTLRVGASSSFVVREVIPSLPPFLRRHPGLKVELAVDDRYQDLVVERLDVALRFGSLRDSTATARLLDASPRLLLASPDYIRTEGQPVVPADLSNHCVILGPTGALAGTWPLSQKKGRFPVQLGGHLSVTSNEGAVAAAVAGLGIVSTVLWGCRTELEKGTLVKILPDWEADLLELHAVYPPARAAKPAARAFVDHLASHLILARSSA